MKIINARIILLACCLLGTGMVTIVGSIPISLSLLSGLFLASSTLLFSFKKALTSPVLLGVLAFGGLVGIANGGILGLSNVAYQIAGILLYYLASIQIIRMYKYDYERLMNDYVSIALFASMLAVVQNIGAILDIQFLWDMRWLIWGQSEPERVGYFVRAASFFTEPGYFVFLPASAMIYISQSASISIKKIVLLGSGVILSMSTLGLIGLAVAILLSMRLTVRSFVTIIFSSLILMIAVLQIPAVSIRVNDLFLAIFGGLSGEENLSVFIRVVDFEVMKNMLSDFWVTGTGLGTYKMWSSNYHDIFYDSNVALRGVIDNLGADEFSIADGGTLASKLAVEFGIPCTLFISYIFFRSMSLIRSFDQALFALLIAFFAIYSLRTGQYIRFEFIFFITLMVYVLNTIRATRATSSLTSGRKRIGKRLRYPDINISST